MQTITVKVIANAKKDEVKGAMADGTLKIAVRAPRSDGKANAAVRAVIAGEFGCSVDDVMIVRGLRATKKVIAINVES